MGGSSGSSQAVPAAPTPIDAKALMAASSDAARAQVAEQFADQAKYYPVMEKLQLGTVGKIAGNLNDAYTKQAKGVIDHTFQQGASALADTGNRINALGDQSQAISTSAQNAALAGPSSIERDLYNQTAADLALGSQLNPEEARAASQQASNAYAMRGLGTGNSAAAADLLNRYQYGQARLAQRQGAASSADTLLQNAQNNRFSTASGLLGNTANLYGQAGGAYQNAASLGFSGANALVNLDPYQRAMGVGVQLGNGIAGTNGQMIGQAYQGANQLFGDAASYNTNMQSSMYNSAMNNNAALGAARTSSQGSMFGAGVGAIGTVGLGVGMAL